jgi:hypothetical protein
MRTVNVVAVVGAIVGIAVAVFALANSESRNMRIAIMILIAIFLGQLLARIAEIKREP